MILKIRDLADEHWTFADNIRSLTHWETVSTDTTLFEYDGVVSYFGPDERSERAECRVVVATCEMNDGAFRRYIFMPGFAFLLNDHGKTVERL